MRFPFYVSRDMKLVTSPTFCGCISNVFRPSWHCRSDVHFWKRGRIGSLTVDGDCILGHEAAGVVVKCGEGVADLKPGENRTWTPAIGTNRIAA